MNQNAPIVLFVFRRPEHTFRVLESLSKNKELASSDLFIYCEGPRDANDAHGVEATREVVRKYAVAQNVTIVEREHNLGCAASIVAGIDEVLVQHDRIIVLEDDLVVSCYFLEYMNSALQRYASCERIMHVSGYMAKNDFADCDACLFLPLTSSWGWATWRRAWGSFDRELTSLPWLDESVLRVFRFDICGSVPYRKMLTQYQRGEIDAWDIRWYLGFFRQTGMAVFPGRSLVANLGFDGSGTHETDPGNTESPEAVAFRRVVKWPTRLEVKWLDLFRFSTLVGSGMTWKFRARALLSNIVNHLMSRSGSGLRR